MGWIGYRVVVVALSISAGCSSDENDEAPDDSAEAMRSALCDLDDLSEVSGVSDVSKCFTDMELLAGTGLVDEGGVSGWQAAFEGDPGVNVELSRPHMTQADAAGNLYIADKDAHAIRKLDPDGVLTTIAGVNEPGDDGDDPGPGTERHLSAPNGLWVQEDGTLFILDLDNQKIRRLSLDGELTTLFRVDGLAVGRGLWVSDAEDEAFVASQDRVFRWSVTDGVQVHAEGFVNLGNVMVDRDGALLVTDRTLGTLSVIDARGEATLLAGGGSEVPDAALAQAVLAPEAALPGLRAVWPDEKGGIFLGQHEGSRVAYLDANGRVYSLLSFPDVDEVRSVSLDHNGDLIVTDGDGGFVKRWNRR